MTDLVIAAHDALDAFLVGNGFQRWVNTDAGPYWTDDDIGLEVAWLARTGEVVLRWIRRNATVATFPAAHPRLVARVRDALTEVRRATHTPKGTR